MKITKKERRTKTNSKKQLRRFNNKIFRIQENSLKNQTKILLKQNDRGHKTIRTRIRKMLTRKKLLQKRYRIRNKTFEENLKKDIY